MFWSPLLCRGINREGSLCFQRSQWEWRPHGLQTHPSLPLLPSQSCSPCSLIPTSCYFLPNTLPVHKSLCQPSAFRAFHTHKMICFYTNHLFHGKYTVFFFTQMIPNPGKRLGRMVSLHYKHKEIVVQRDQVICPGLYS